jgi:hypothetical protein
MYRAENSQRKVVAAGCSASVGRFLPSKESVVAIAKELLLIFGAYGVYLIVRNLIVPTAQTTAFLNAERLIDFEKSLHFYWEPGWQQWALGHAEWSLDFSNWFYVFGYMPIILTTATMVYIFDRERYRRYRSVMLVSLFLALIVFTTFPLAPPRFPDTGSGMIDILALNGSIISKPGSESFYNQYAAMPSLHFGWALLISILFLTSKSSVWKVCGIVYPVAMLFTIVLTANHYILDAVGGVGIIGLSYLVYRALFVDRERLLQRLPWAKGS